MEERREGVMEDLKEMRMELRVMKMDLNAMRRSLEEIETWVKEGIAGTREEREVRRERGIEWNKGGGESKEERRREAGDSVEVGDGGVKAEGEKEEGSWMEDRGGFSDKWRDVGGGLRGRKRGEERRVKKI